MDWNWNVIWWCCSWFVQQMFLSLEVNFILIIQCSSPFSLFGPMAFHHESSSSKHWNKKNSSDQIKTQQVLGDGCFHLKLDSLQLLQMTQLPFKKEVHRPFHTFHGSNVKNWPNMKCQIKISLAAVLNVEPIWYYRSDLGENAVVAQESFALLVVVSFFKALVGGFNQLNVIGFVFKTKTTFSRWKSTIVYDWNYQLILAVLIETIFIYSYYLSKKKTLDKNWEDHWKESSNKSSLTPQTTRRSMQNPPAGWTFVPPKRHTRP